MELKYTITIIHTPCTHKQKERVCRNNIDCSLHLWPFFDRQARSRAYRLGKKKVVCMLVLAKKIWMCLKVIHDLMSTFELTFHQKSSEPNLIMPAY